MAGFPVLEDGLSRAIIQGFVIQHDIVTAQKEDPILSDIFKILNNEVVDNNIASSIYKNKDNLILDNDTLCFLLKNSKRIAIPQNLQAEVIHGYHDLPTSGHLSYIKTYNRMMQHEWFPKMFSIVKKY